MSALDFLSPSVAADDGDFHPVAQSALLHAQREAGATIEERGGWLVPVSLPDEDAFLATVGIADLSHVSKLEVKPAGAPATGRAVQWYPLSPRRALCFCHAPELDAVRAQLADRLVVDVTAGYAVLALVGLAADTLLRRLTHLHTFPSGGAVAHVTAHVLPQEQGYWLVVPQEYGHYLWEVAVDRALPLGGGPIGVDALARVGA